MSSNSGYYWVGSYIKVLKVGLGGFFPIPFMKIEETLNKFLSTYQYYKIKKLNIFYIFENIKCIFLLIFFYEVVIARAFYRSHFPQKAMSNGKFCSLLYLLQFHHEKGHIGFLSPPSQDNGVKSRKRSTTHIKQK